MPAPETYLPADWTLQTRPRFPTSGLLSSVSGVPLRDGGEGATKDSVRLDPGTSPNALPSSQDQGGGYEHRRGDFPSLSLSPGRPGLSPRGRGEPRPRDPTPSGALNFLALRVQAPLQDWGEETEDGAVYSVSLRRQRSQRLSPTEGAGDSQVRRGLKGAAGQKTCR